VDGDRFSHEGFWAEGWYNFTLPPKDRGIAQVNGYSTIPLNGKTDKTKLFTLELEDGAGRQEIGKKAAVAKLQNAKWF